MSLSKEKNNLLYLLSRQDYSRKQLSNKLSTRANISDNEIVDLLDEFENKKCLSDERFADTFVFSEINKLRGKKRIFNIGVYQKGLSTALVDKYLSAADADWFELFSRRLQKKYNYILNIRTDINLKNKVVNYLLYNGFSYDEINFAIYSDIWKWQ